MKDAAAAAKFSEDFKSVVGTFHGRVGARELEDGVVLREGVRHPLTNALVKIWR